MSGHREAIQADAGDAGQVPLAKLPGVRIVGMAMLQEKARAMVVAAAAGETVMVIDDTGKPIAQITASPLADHYPKPKNRYEELVAAGRIFPGNSFFWDLPMPEQVRSGPASGQGAAGGVDGVEVDDGRAG